MTAGVPWALPDNVPVTFDGHPEPPATRVSTTEPVKFGITVLPLYVPEPAHSQPSMGRVTVRSMGTVISAFSANHVPLAGVDDVQVPAADFPSALTVPLKVAVPNPPEVNPKMKSDPVRVPDPVALIVNGHPEPNTRSSASEPV